VSSSAFGFWFGGQYRVRGPTGNCNGRSGALLQWQKLWRHPDPLCRSGCHRQQRHLRPLVNLERETVFRRFLKHLHLLYLRTSYSLAQFLYAPVFYEGKIVAGRKSRTVCTIQRLQRWKVRLQHTTRAMPPDLSD